VRAVKEIDRLRANYHEVLTGLGRTEVVAAGPVMAAEPQVRGAVRRWWRRRRGSQHPADRIANLNVLALADGALWLHRAPKWGPGGVPGIEELVGWWPVPDVRLASSYKELQSYDHDTNIRYRTKVVQLGIKAAGDDRLTVLHGMQNEQTRELVREIKRATGQRKD
jgi:hypothetical protein